MKAISKHVIKHTTHQAWYMAVLLNRLNMIISNKKSQYVKGITVTELPTVKAGALKKRSKKAMSNSGKLKKNH